MKRLALSVVVIAGFSIGACSKTTGDSAPSAGGAKPVATRLNDAAAAMQKENWKDALADVDGVLADASATAEQKADAWPDKILCAAHIDGDAAATAALKAMVAAKAELQAKQYAKLCNDLDDINHVNAAIEVVAVAKEKFANDKGVQKILKSFAKRLEAKLKQTGDAAAQQKLASLGYTGGSNDEDDDEAAPPAKKGN